MEEAEKVYIRILSHKKVKIRDEILDILHLEDVANATKTENGYKILSGKYEGKFIVELNHGFQKEDYVATPLTLVEKNLITNSNPTDTSKITLENYLQKCYNYEYFIANVIDKQIVLKVVFQNDEIKEAFKISALPSVSKTLSNLITESTLNGTNSFKINQETMAKILGEEKPLQGQYLKEMLQNEFLSIVQGTVINKKIRNGYMEENISLDTSKITFVFAGAFEEIINRENISTNDLIEYGMIPQLAKRIHSLIKTKLPTKEDLKKALMEGEYSHIKLFEEYLSIYNIKLEVNDEFYDSIVDKAYKLECGYRGLSIALTEYLNEHLYDIYSSKQDVVKLQIT